MAQTTIAMIGHTVKNRHQKILLTVATSYPWPISAGFVSGFVSRVVVVVVVVVMGVRAVSTVVLVAVFVDEGPVDRDAEYVVDDVPPVGFSKVCHESGHWRGLDSGGHSSEDVQGSSSSAVNSRSQVAWLNHLMPRITEARCRIVLLGFEVLLDVLKEGSVASTAFSMALCAIDLGIDEQAATPNPRFLGVRRSWGVRNHQVLRILGIDPVFGDQRRGVGKRFVEGVDGEFFL